MKIGFSRQIKEHAQISIFMNICPGRGELFHWNKDADGWTGGRAERKVGQRKDDETNRCFSQFFEGA
jgi:hypothetical protein